MEGHWQAGHVSCDHMSLEPMVAAVEHYHSIGATMATGSAGAANGPTNNSNSTNRDHSRRGVRKPVRT